MTKPIRNLGRALTILADQEAREHAMHEDVDAFYAPSECHGLVARGEEKRQRQARRHAEAVAGAPLREIRRQARARGGGCYGGGPRWDNLLGRLIDRRSPYGESR